MIWAVVPVKDFQTAKQRLRAVLTPNERQALARAMLEDVLAALAQVRELDRLVLVTREPHAVTLARRFGAFILSEPSNRGQTAAVERAFAQARRQGASAVLALPGDVPLIDSQTLRALVQACGGERLALLTMAFDDPTGYGRIVRGADGTVQAIVEHKDASEAQRRIREVYTGIMAVPARRLKPWLARLDNRNAQQEYYLTDVVRFAVADGVPVVAHVIDDALQVAGVNSPQQLAELERAYQLRQARRLMEQGVRLADPARLDVRGTLVCGQDVEIDVGCIFAGHVELGEGVTVGAHCCIANARIADGAVILPYTHIEGGEAEHERVEVGPQARVGPYARLRPGARPVAARPRYHRAGYGVATRSQHAVTRLLLKGAPVPPSRGAMGVYHLGLGVGPAWETSVRRVHQRSPSPSPLRRPI